MVALSASCEQCSAFSRKISDCFTLSSKREQFRICFNPHPIAQVPDPVILQKIFPASTEMNNHSGIDLAYNLRLSDRPSAGVGAPRPPKFLSSAANDGPAIPADGCRTTESELAERDFAFAPPATWEIDARRSRPFSARLQKARDVQADRRQRRISCRGTCGRPGRHRLPRSARSVRSPDHHNRRRCRAGAPARNYACS